MSKDKPEKKDKEKKDKSSAKSSKKVEVEESANQAKVEDAAQKNRDSKKDSQGFSRKKDEEDSEDFCPIKHDEFIDCFKDIEKILILTHDNPDPDAIAAAFGLFRLLSEKYKKDIRIGHGGIIARTENKLMILNLNIPLYSMQLIGDGTVFDGVILVDTQPEAKYHSLPEDANLIAVFDHHPAKTKGQVDYFQEIRPRIGSTSTIVAHYLKEAEYEIEEDLATALFYGIKTDTLDFSRHTTSCDLEAHQILFPLMNPDKLVRIEKPALPREYFVDLLKGLENADVYDNVVIVDMGRMQNPDMVPLIADLILHLDTAQWGIVIGYYETELRIAVRSNDPKGNAGKLVRKIVKKKGIGGGHQEMAAAQIKLKLADREIEYVVVKQMILEIIIEELKLPNHGLKLCREKKGPTPGSTGKFNR